jgi:hypothetical protein
LAENGRAAVEPEDAKGDICHVPSANPGPTDANGKLRRQGRADPVLLVLTGKVARSVRDAALRIQPAG